MKKYLIRLDDACPTMDIKKWDRIEKILDKYQIKPIVAVIPDNKDPEMMIENIDENFWEKVKRWQAKDWNIALHGYNHMYLTRQKGLIPINSRSEFAGLDFIEQKKKIKKAWDIFKSKGIKTEIWIAPSHSFDDNTLKVLKEITRIKIISDGIAYYPYTEKGFFWIPQQSWDLKEKRKGIWTICLHPNTMNNVKFELMEAFCRKNRNNFLNDISASLELYHNRKKDNRDRIFEKVFFLKKTMDKKKWIRLRHASRNFISKFGSRLNR